MIYVMSDIHGNMRRFRSVMEQINLQPEDTLYVLGDVIDRFPYGIEILQELMAMPNVKMLLGNHEYMMLNAMDGHYVDTGLRISDLRDALLLWYDNDGWVTQQAFSVGNMPTILFGIAEQREGFHIVRNYLSAEERRGIG